MPEDSITLSQPIAAAMQLRLPGTAGRVARKMRYIDEVAPRFRAGGAHLGRKHIGAILTAVQADGIKGAVDPVTQELARLVADEWDDLRRAGVTHVLSYSPSHQLGQPISAPTYAFRR